MYRFLVSPAALRGVKLAHGAELRATVARSLPRTFWKKSGSDDAVAGGEDDEVCRRRLPLRYNKPGRIFLCFRCSSCHLTRLAR